MDKNNYQKITLGDISKAFWNGMKGVRLAIFGAFLFAVILQTVNVIIPIFYKRFFDQLEGINPGDSVNLLVVTLVIVFGLNLLWSGLDWIARILISKGEARAMAQLKQQASAYLMRHSLDFFANTFTGSMVTRVQRFARGFERIADSIVFNLIPILINVSGAIIVVFFIQPLLSLILLVWSLVFIVIGYFYGRWRLRHNIEVAAVDSRVTGALADSITNQSSIMLFSAFSGENNRFEQVTEEQEKKVRHLWYSNNAMDALQNFFLVSVEFAALLSGLYFWQQGLVTLGSLVLLQTYVLQIGGRIQSFSRIIRDAYEVHADATEMLEIMKLPHQIRDVPRAKKLSVAEGAITFDSVVFNFNETRSVIDHLNLTISGGQRVGVVGPSGAGKTTLVRLILRLYDITGGRILIDGQNIQQVQQDSLRAQVAFVPQEPVLFHRSLRENIAYGNPDASLEEVIEAARRAEAHEFIMELPDGYETLVGERGVKLSGGQRQRVAIARAILKNAPILVLDEATSSLDSESEVAIQKALAELMQGKTVIAIAHRLSTIRAMDRIIVLENGKIVEDGTHEALVKSGGTYARLWQHQAGGFVTGEL